MLMLLSLISAVTGIMLIVCKDAVSQFLQEIYDPKLNWSNQDTQSKRGFYKHHVVGAGIMLLLFAFAALTNVLPPSNNVQPSNAASTSVVTK
jgi:hypothetical protein